MEPTFKETHGMITLNKNDSSIFVFVIAWRTARVNGGKLEINDFYPLDNEALALQHIRQMCISPRQYIYPWYDEFLDRFLSYKQLL